MKLAFSGNFHFIQMSCSSSLLVVAAAEVLVVAASERLVVAAAELLVVTAQFRRAFTTKLMPLWFSVTGVLANTSPVPVMGGPG